MKISIVTIVLNNVETIEQAIYSVLSQKGIDFEYVIVDGFSDDGSFEIISSYQSFIHRIVRGRDFGLYDAMNKGLSFCTGDVIGFLNADDFYANSQVLSKVSRLFSEKNCDVVYGDLQYVNPEDANSVVRRWVSGEYRREKFLNGWMPPHPTFFAKRDLFEKYGYFDPTFSSAADYELMLRFLYKHKATACYLPECLTKMRTGGVSNASLKHRLRANHEDRMAWVKNSLKPSPFTTYLKPLRKITQFLPGQVSSLRKMVGQKRNLQDPAFEALEQDWQGQPIEKNSGKKSPR